MLEHGADVNAVINGSTLLHQSLDRDEAFVRLLAEKGAKLDIKDATGRTPLDIALGVAPPAAVAGPARRQLLSSTPRPSRSCASSRRSNWSRGFTSLLHLLVLAHRLPRRDVSRRKKFTHPTFSEQAGAIREAKLHGK